MSNPSEFTLYESHHTPLDDVQASLDRVGRWPLRLLLLALVSPVIVAFGNQVEFLWPWAAFSEPDLLRAGPGWLALTPLVAAGLLFASRFGSSTCRRGLLCTFVGLAVLGPLTYYTHWLVPVSIFGAMFVSIGNRVGKEFNFSWAPRIVAASGGITLLTIFFWYTAESGALKLLFSAKSWNRGQWVFCVPTVAMLLFSAAGALLITPLRSKLPLAVVVSGLARLTLLWFPFAFLYGGAMLSQGLGIGMFGQSAVTTTTIGFKLFGIAYPLLIATAVGLASLLAGWLWSKTDADPVDPPDLPGPPDNAMEETPPAAELEFDWSTNHTT